MVDILKWWKENIEGISEADEAYAKLNNLYLSIQRGDTKLTRREYNDLNDYLCKVYSHKDPMFDWWIREFYKLPGWLNV